MGIFDFKEFAFRSNKVLPTEYDDALSYYEVLNKVAARLNDVSNAANALADSLVAPYDSTVQYNPGDYVWYNNALYKCTTANYGAFNPVDWGGEPVVFTEAVGDDIISLRTYLETAVNNQQSLIERTIAGIASPYDATHNYEPGDYVSYLTPTGGIIYKCIGNTTGTFDSSKWTAVVAINELFNYVSELWANFITEYQRLWGLSFNLGYSEELAPTEMIFTTALENATNLITNINLDNCHVLNSAVNIDTPPTWARTYQNSCYIVPLVGCKRFSIESPSQFRAIQIKSTDGYDTTGTRVDIPEDEVLHIFSEGGKYSSNVLAGVKWLCIRKTNSKGVEDAKPSITLYSNTQYASEKIEETIGGQTNVNLELLSIVELSFYNNKATFARVGSNFVLPVNKAYKQIYIEAGETPSRYIFVKTLETTGTMSDPATDSVCTEIQAGQSSNISIPDDANYVLIWRTNSSNEFRTPASCYFNLYNISSVLPVVTELKCNKTIFRKSFIETSSVTADYTDLIGVNDSYKTANGYRPASGYSNKAKIDKYIVSDYVALAMDITLENPGAGSCFIGTIDSGFTQAVHATTIEFDFTNGKIKFLSTSENGGNYSGDTLPQYTYAEQALNYLSGTKYRIEIGRNNRCPYAKVFNRATGKLCGYKKLDIYEGSSSYGQKCGALYDFPVFGTLSGSIYFESVTCKMPTIDNVFLGDSITEGSRLPVSLAWANIIGAKIGNSLNMGRGGGSILHVLRASTDILPFIKPKRAIVTIGTNGGNTVARLNQLKSNLDTIGCELIINTIPMMSSPPTAVNNMILDMNLPGARFDVATATNNNPAGTQNSSLFFDDNVHPNALGSQAMAEQFEASIVIE